MLSTGPGKWHLHPRHLGSAGTGGYKQLYGNSQPIRQYKKALWDIIR